MRLSALAACLLAGCGNRPTSAVAPALRTPIHATDAAAAATANNRFGFDVFIRLRSPAQNLIFSPLSVSLALAMTASGAKGETLAQMSRVLHVVSLADGNSAFGDLSGALVDVSSVLHVADRIWTQAGFSYRQDFVSGLFDHYSASAGMVDFERSPEPARLEINAWIDEQTQHRIRELLPPGIIDPVTTRLVLTNAIYFKAPWSLPFLRGATHEKMFTAPGGAIRVPVMQQVSHFAYARLGGLALVELPYAVQSRAATNPLSMIVVLPDSANGLVEVENRVGRDYETWIATLADRQVDLWLPRWRETQTLRLKGALAGLGMPLPFARCEADFSRMTDAQDGVCPPGHPFFIDEVIQKAFIDADEIGTEAAAATAEMVAMPMSLVQLAPPDPPPVVFHVDHPFLYVIRERTTGAILFVGRVVEPKQDQ